MKKVPDIELPQSKKKIIIEKKSSDQNKNLVSEMFNVLLDNDEDSPKNSEGSIKQKKKEKSSQKGKKKAKKNSNKKKVTRKKDKSTEKSVQDEEEEFSPNEQIKEQKKKQTKKEKSVKQKPKKKDSQNEVKKDSKDKNKVVLNLLEQYNQPFTVPLILDRLKGQVTKKDLLIILGDLIVDLKIVTKEIGRTVLYWLNQENINTSEEALKKEEENIVKNQEIFEELSQKQKDLKKKLQSLSQMMTIDEIKTNLQKAKKRNSEILDTLTHYGNIDESKFNKEDFDIKQKELQKRQNDIKKMKKSYNLIISTLQEGQEKSKEELEELIGIEEYVNYND